MVENLKVLMLPLHRYIDSNWGSECAWDINIAKSVARQGVSFTAVVGQADRNTRRLIEGTGNKVTEMGTGRERNFRSDLSFYSKLFYTGVKLTAKNRPDLVHHVFPLGYNVGFNPCILFNPSTPAIVGPLLFPGSDSEDEPELMRYFGVWHDNPQTYPRSFFSVLYRQTLLKSSYIFFDSEATRAAVLRLEPRLRDKRYGVLPTGGVDIPNDNAVCKKIPLEKKKFLTVGTLSYLRRRKHLDTLIRAVALLRDRAVRLVIGGDGPILVELSRLSEEMRVKDQVEFFGRVRRDHVPEYLSGIDILCSLDKVPHEAMASVQEAMTFGIAVIASTVEPLPKAQELPYGFLVDAHSQEQVSYAIERFAADPDLVFEKGAAARDFAIANFSLESVGKKIREAYESCVKLT